MINILIIAIAIVFITILVFVGILCASTYGTRFYNFVDKALPILFRTLYVLYGILVVYVVVDRIILK